VTYETMIEKNDLLIKKLAHKYNVTGYSYEDRYQECLCKLWNVYKDYDDKYALTTFITVVCKKHLLALNKYNNVYKRSNYINGKRVSNIINYNLVNNILDYKDINIYSEFEEEVLDCCYKELETLSPKIKEMIKLTLDGVTNQDVGKKFNVTKQRVNKVYRDYIKKCQNLVDKLKEKEYNNSEVV